MRTFSDLLETVTPVANAAARQLTTTANVKAMLGITDSSTDTIINSLIDRATGQMADYCKLARDVVGNRPTFGTEVLRATWYPAHFHPQFGPYRGNNNPDSWRRGPSLYLPWRVPISLIDSVTEDGTTLTLGTDYKFTGGFSGELKRFDGDGATPKHWSHLEVVVQFESGWSLPASVPPEVEAACIEQVRYVFLGRQRDRSVRSEAVPDLATIAYSVPGGDVMGASGLLPDVRDALEPYRNPVP
jgi:hypothetical protein